MDERVHGAWVKLLGWMFERSDDGWMGRARGNGKGQRHRHFGLAHITAGRHGAFVVLSSLVCKGANTSESTSID